MQYRVFQYPLPTDPELPELNAFLTSQRIATVQQSIVNTSGGPMLVFVVESVSGTSQSSGAAAGKSKIDFREVLSENEFQIFSRLRDKRKEIANSDGVPVYAVFSNAQLADIVQKRVTTKKQLASVPGIGESRCEKYASQLLPILQEAFESTVTPSDENAGNQQDTVE